jgi:hypothetical protein
MLHKIYYPDEMTYKISMFTKSVFKEKNCMTLNDFVVDKFITEILDRYMKIIL